MPRVDSAAATRASDTRSALAEYHLILIGQIGNYGS